MKWWTFRFGHPLGPVSVFLVVDVLLLVVSTIAMIKWTAPSWVATAIGLVVMAGMWTLFGVSIKQIAEMEGDSQ